MDQKIGIIIPARDGSSRFPHKPLAKICGVPMLERMWKLANQLDVPVIITSESKHVLESARRFGVPDVSLVLTGNCRNGTERVFEACRSRQFESVINLQGDAVLLPPWVIADLLAWMRTHAGEYATVAVPMDWEVFQRFEKEKVSGRASGTLVVCNMNHQAMYFSKNMIPSVRNKPEKSPYLRHIGIYGYRLSGLKKYMDLAPTPLEEIEGLEQLRLLEHGYPLHVVMSSMRGRTMWSIDYPEDIAVAERILQQEGEL